VDRLKKTEATRFFNDVSTNVEPFLNTNTLAPGRRDKEQINQERSCGANCY
jgi:hypothetical protein